MTHEGFRILMITVKMEASYRYVEQRVPMPSVLVRESLLYFDMVFVLTCWPLLVESGSPKNLYFAWKDRQCG